MIEYLPYLMLGVVSMALLYLISDLNFSHKNS